MLLPLLFPLASGPLDKIPPDRLGTWPLTRRQRRFLDALRFPALKIGPGAIRWIPLLRGPLGGIVTSHWRGMFTALDTWLTVLLSLVATGYRLFGSHSDPESLPIFAMLIALALSTQTQSLFGLDYASGVLRLRILPLTGWRILLAKDIAWLSVLMLLIAPLSVIPALTFGLTALAIGHHSSVILRLPQTRWRFAGGRFLPGALQLLLSIAFGFAELRRGPIFFAVAACLYALSLAIYGALFTRQSQPENTLR